MLFQTIGELLPVAAAVALSPIPIIAIVIVLGTDRARSNGPAFVAGWILGLAALTSVVVSFANGVNADGSTAAGVARVAVGLGCFALATKKWRARPRPGETSDMPGWMATLDKVHPRRAFVLGVALSGANPKNVALTAKAAATITDMDLTPADTRAAVTIFVAMGSITVLGAVIAHAVGGDRSRTALDSVKAFMVANNNVIVMLILVLIGASILGDGIATLSG